MTTKTYQELPYAGRTYAIRSRHEVDELGQTWLVCWYHDRAGVEHALRMVLANGEPDIPAEITLRQEMRHGEKRITSDELCPTTYTHTIVFGTHVAGRPWTDPESHPRVEVERAVMAMFHACHRQPVRLQLSPQSASALAGHPSTQSELRYADPTHTIWVGSDLLPSTYRGLPVVVEEDGGRVPAGAAWLISEPPGRWQEVWVWQIAGCAAPDATPDR